MIAGMVTAPVALAFLTGEGAQIAVPASTTALVIGGAIVGVGVLLGSGCTSGHGVCGLARLSSRSVVAVLTFMATTAITVYISRHIIGG